MLQIVPSYLEVVLTYLEQHPRELPDLRCVSVTGRGAEAGAGPALVRRPARDQAGQRLRADRDLGRHQPRGHGPGPGRAIGPARPAVQNVRVYVVDEQLRPVPLGAPGEIVFSGVCVGRGYINDPERTAAGLPDRPAPPGRAALPGRRLRPLAPGRQAGVPRPPRQPGEDLRVPDRDRRDREHPAAGARRARRRRRRRRAGRREQAPGRVLLRRAAARGRRCCATGSAESLPGYMVPTAFHWRERAAADRQRQDRQEGADRAGRRARRRRRGRRRARPRRPSSGWPPRGRRCSACRSSRSAGATTSSTRAARRCPR